MYVFTSRKRMLDLPLKRTDMFVDEIILGSDAKDGILYIESSQTGEVLHSSNITGEYDWVSVKEITQLEAPKGLV